MAQAGCSVTFVAKGGSYGRALATAGSGRLAWPVVSFSWDSVWRPPMSWIRRRLNSRGGGARPYLGDGMEEATSRPSPAV